nr:hypothetical protein [Tanacetum cinerariifolium]GEX99651.1 hypothetical protein [Tanacetum cinerariifolium]
MEFVKKSIDERAHHKREYDSRVNERHMQTTEKKVDMSKALDASLVDTESSVTESLEKDTSSRLRNDAHADDADIRPIYDEEPMDENFKATVCPQVDVNNDLPKLVTTHCLPREKEPAFAKPHHVIASSESRNSLKNMPRFSSNDMVHNHYLEEAKKKTKERDWNSRPSRSTHVQRFHPIRQRKSVAKKPKRQISKAHRFSIKMTSVVHEKTMTPRSCLRWKPTGKFFKTIGLRWVPTGKIFNSSTTKVDSEPPNGSNADITNQYECEQTLDVSAGTLNLSEMTSDHNSLELRIHDHNNEPSSSKLVPKIIPSADKTATS